MRDPKIAVIGEKDVICVWKAVGAEIFPYTHANKIKETVKDLAAKQYKIILITENEARESNDFLDEFSDQAYPIIIPIPNGVENLGFGQKLVQQYIAKAIGSQ